MKFSLKEFFLREGGNFNAKSSVNMGGTSSAASSHASSATSGKKSSTNVQINIGEAYQEESKIQDVDALAASIEKKKYGSTRGGPKGFHRKMVKKLQQKNESLEEAQSFQLPDHVLREFQQVPPVPRPGATAWSSPSEPVTIKKFFNRGGNLDIDLEEGGPGSGRKKGSKNKPKGSQVISPGGEASPDLPDEPDPSWFRPPAEPSSEDPFSRQEGDLGDDLSWLDDPNLGKNLEPISKAEPRGTKSKKDEPEAEPVADEPMDTSFLYDPTSAPESDEEGMDWDEFQANHPQEADDLAFELGRKPKEGTKFVTRGGFIHMREPDGSRWKYSKASDWLEVGED